MKTRAMMIVLAMMVVAGVLAGQVSAIYIPDPGNVKLKLTNSENLYTDGDIPDPRTDIFPDGLSDADFLGSYKDDLNNGLAGTRSITAYRITSVEVGTPPVPDGSELTGIVTFLKVASVDTAILGDRLISLNLGDDGSRDHQLAGGGTDPLTGNPTIGRFFLFQNIGPDMGDFSVLGGRPGDVDFSAGLGDHTVTSNGVDFFEIDVLDNFTSGTLLMTGSLVADADGTVPNLLTEETGIDGVSWQGIINSRNVLIDGGVWFDLNVVTRAAFKINQFGYDGTATDPNLPFPGDEQVFDGGWQISSEDPITFVANSPIPEPMTATLALLAAGGLTTYLRRRRL